jgi:hypothetical protein
MAEAKEELEAKSKAELEAKACKANRETIITTSNVYAAYHDGIYPTSWEDLVPIYLDKKLYCPSDGSEYIILWNRNTPPTVRCPNHY